jgi:hypothetical protein
MRLALRPFLLRGVSQHQKRDRPEARRHEDESNRLRKSDFRDAACKRHTHESEQDRRPLRPRGALAEERLSRQGHQNRREEVEGHRLPKAEASDREIEGHPAAEHHLGADGEESLPRRDKDVLNETRPADRQCQNEDRGAPHKKDGSDRKSHNHLLGERILQRKEHIGAEDQEDR